MVAEWSWKTACITCTRRFRKPGEGNASPSRRQPSHVGSSPAAGGGELHSAHFLRLMVALEWGRELKRGIHEGNARRHCLVRRHHPAVARGALPTYRRSSLEQLPLRAGSARRAVASPHVPLEGP